MTVVNPKSISGINSITMASGSDNLLTIHSNNTTERVRVDSSGNLTATSFSGDGSSLTGVASTENIRTNTNATFLQNVNVSGSTTTGSLVSSGAISGTTGTFTSHVSLGDNDQLRIGDGDDLQIYHDASNTVLVNNTGDLYIQNDSSNDTNKILIRPKAGESSIECVPNGEVSLHHNNNKSLETTSDGGVKAQGNYIVGTSGRGIQFNASDSGSSEILDDYEEGTWTAALSDGETCTSSSTRYTKIGCLVTVYAYITNFSDFNGNNNNFKITGLPFASRNQNSYHGGGSISYAHSFNYSYPILPLTASNSSYIYFHRQDGTTAAWQYQDFHNTSNGSGGQLIVQFTYETDS